jgi:hypothetical protein
MASVGDLKERLRLSPQRTTLIALAIVAVVGSGWLGFSARRATAELASARETWSRLDAQIATARQQFRPLSEIEAALLVKESARMGALGVPSGEQLSVMDAVGRLAEACALDRVRVTVAPAQDSAFVAARVIAGKSVERAKYALAVEFRGGFDNAVKFVSSLPPAVSVSRLSAGRREAGTMYQLVLSVYELNGDTGR